VKSKKEVKNVNINDFDDGISERKYSGNTAVPVRTLSKKKRRRTILKSSEHLSKR